MHFSILSSNSALDSHFNPAQSPHPLPHRVWETYLKVLRILGPYLLRCARDPVWHLHVLDEKLVLQILAWGWEEAFKRLRAQVLNPYTFKILLEVFSLSLPTKLLILTRLKALSALILCANEITHLTLTSDEIYRTLLLALFKVLFPYSSFIKLTYKQTYKQVLRPYIINTPGFKDLDATLGANPKTISYSLPSYVSLYILTFESQLQNKRSKY